MVVILNVRLIDQSIKTGIRWEEEEGTMVREWRESVDCYQA